MTAIQQFNFDVDLLQALLWQYNDAARLQSILRQKEAWYEAAHAEFWNAWITDVFDLRTANDFGLSIWGRLLGVPLVAPVAGSGAREVWGFGVHNRNFFDGNFGRDTSSTISLTTEQKRLVLRLRYYQITTQATVPEINRVLAELFGAGTYVLDGGDMTAVYVFTYVPDAAVLFVLERFDLLIRPAGVELQVLIEPGDSFGFDPYYLNFENSNFGGA